MIIVFYSLSNQTKISFSASSSLSDSELNFNFFHELPIMPMRIKKLNNNKLHEQTCARHVRTCLSICA